MAPPAKATKAGLSVLARPDIVHLVKVDLVKQLPEALGEVHKGSRSIIVALPH